MRQMGHFFTEIIYYVKNSVPLKDTYFLHVTDIYRKHLSHLSHLSQNASRGLFIRKAVSSFKSSGLQRTFQWFSLYNPLKSK